MQIPISTNPIGEMESAWKFIPPTEHCNNYITLQIFHIFLIQISYERIKIRSLLLKINRNDFNNNFLYSHRGILRWLRKRNS